MLKAVVHTPREGTCAVMRVLVVEDFEPTARAIVTGLRREGMAVDVAYDGDEALGHLALTRYDVVVLGRDLPAAGGRAVTKPDPDADRGGQPDRPGGRPGHRRRRLPGQALRLPRADRPR